MKIETKEKEFFIQSVVVVARDTAMLKTQLTCSPEEMDAFGALVGKRVRIKSTIEVIEDTVDAVFEPETQPEKKE